MHICRRTGELKPALRSPSNRRATMLASLTLAIIFLMICECKGDADEAFVQIDLKVHPGEAFATSNNIDADRAFRLDYYSSRQYWSGERTTSRGRGQRRAQVIWFRFDEPIQIAMISFDACHTKYGCYYDARKKQGPLEYRIVVAKKCSSHFMTSEWHKVQNTFYRRDKWRYDTPAEHQLYDEESYRCYGIEIERVDSGKKGPAVANIKFWTTTCDEKFDETVPFGIGWDCNGNILGSKCVATCSGGRSPFGKAVCRRNGRFLVDGLSTIEANREDLLQKHIGCEYQCKRPTVDDGLLRECERPRDGAQCIAACERGFTDVRSIECHLVGNTTVTTASGKEEHPYRWTVNDNSDASLNYDLICASAGQRSSGDCERDKKCHLGFVTEAQVTKYLGPKAVVNRTAVLVTYNDLDYKQSNLHMWGGKLPWTCPKPKAIFESRSCHAEDKKECYVAAVLEKGVTLSSVVLGDEETYGAGGCVNRPLETAQDKSAKVIAIFQLSDGTIRKMILLNEPPRITTTQIAIIVGVVVGIVLAIVGCCVCCNRKKIFKRESSSSRSGSHSNSSTPPPPAATVPLMIQQPPVQPPPPAQQMYPPDGAANYPQYPYHPAATNPQAPYPPFQPAPPPQDPYPAGPPTYAPMYPNVGPGAGGMQPVAPYPTEPVPPPPSASLPYPT